MPFELNSRFCRQPVNDGHFDFFAEDGFLSTTSSIYDQIQETLQQSGTEAALEKLAAELVSSKKFHELFEARKLQLRLQLGLPLLFSEAGDDLDDATRNKLEDGLSEICRDIGAALMADGRLREGWMYLRPVGENEIAKEYLLRTETNDENIDELIELALREGIAPAHGFNLVLQHYGTCNSITTFDAEMNQQPPAEKKMAAGMLVEHLHAELLENVLSDITSEETTRPTSNRFAELLPEREWLFDGNRYHIDTTHLASVIRFARVLSDENQIKLAIDLTEYGQRLSSQYQYENEEPFSDLYPTTRLYLNAILGNDVADAVTFFEKKARECDTYNQGYMPVEVYIELLSRVGKPAEAMEALIELMPDASPKIGIAPTIMELANSAKDFGRFTRFCRENDDLLGFVTGLLHSEKK